LSGLIGTISSNKLLRHFEIFMTIKRKFVNAFPKSSKAKIYFDNKMYSLHGMEVMEETDDQFYLVSGFNQSKVWFLVW